MTDGEAAMPVVPATDLVSEVRVSFVASEALPQLLSRSAYPLATPEGYQAEFDRARAGGSSSPFQLPWRDDDWSFFWQYYLGIKDYFSVTANRAEKLHVPLRYRHGLGVTLASPPEGAVARIALDGYVYPFAVASVVNVTLRWPEGRTLAGAVDDIVAMPKRTFGLTHDGQAEATTSVVGAPVQVQRVLRKAVTGSNDAGWSWASDPCTITTVVRGQMPVGQALVAESELHRALEGMCRFRAQWATEQPAPLAQALQPTGAGAVPQEVGYDPREVIYRRGRGLALWFPELFNVVGRRARTAGCLHRNQVLLALQVETALNYVGWAARELEEGRSLSQLAERKATSAADLLGRMYGGTETYRSWTAVAHIDGSRLVPAIEMVRSLFGAKQPTLTHRPPPAAGATASG